MTVQHVASRFRSARSTARRKIAENCGVSAPEAHSAERGLVLARRVVPEMSSGRLAGRSRLMMRWLAPRMQPDFFASPDSILALDWLLMTNAEQNRIERRSGQRFGYQIPVLLRVPSEGHTGAGCTQDLSARGALVWTDLPLKEGALVEMTLVMPA